jgi:hypothetical protein
MASQAGTAPTYIFGLYDKKIFVVEWFGIAMLSVYLA